MFSESDNNHSSLPWQENLKCLTVLLLGAIVTGLLSALVGYLFSNAVQLGRSWIAPNPWVMILGTPFLAGALAFTTQRYFRHSEGSGIPQVIAALESMPTGRIASLVLSVRIVIGKLILATFAIFFGMSLGREGPTVQIGASVMYRFRQLYKRPSDFWDKLFIMAGGGAGLAAAFNAPIAGVVFAIEELAGRFWRRMILLLFVCIGVSIQVVQYFNGDHLYFGEVHTQKWGLVLLPDVILAGVVCGLVGGAFNWMVLNTSRWMPKCIHNLKIRNSILFPILCGLIVGIVNVWSHGQTFGDGREPAFLYLHGLAVPSAWYGLQKWLATLFTYLCGIPGGLFSPSLSTASGIASFLEVLNPYANAPELVLLCMVAYMSAVTQSPITSLVITLEMTGDFSLTGPMVGVSFIGCYVSSLIAPGIYAALAKSKYGLLAPKEQK